MLLHGETCMGHRNINQETTQFKILCTHKRPELGDQNYVCFSFLYCFIKYTTYFQICLLMSEPPQIPSPAHTQVQPYACPPPFFSHLSPCLCFSIRYGHGHEVNSRIFPPDLKIKSYIYDLKVKSLYTISEEIHIRFYPQKKLKSRRNETFWLLFFCYFMQVDAFFSVLGFVRMFSEVLYMDPQRHKKQAFFLMRFRIVLKIHFTTFPL